MSQYTQGLAYDLNPQTFINQAFPHLPESIPVSVTNVAYDSGAGAVVNSSIVSGIVYNSDFGINPNDFAVYFTLRLTSGGFPGTQIASLARVLGFVNSDGLTIGEISLGTWSDFVDYVGADGNVYLAPTSIVTPVQYNTCNYHWKFPAPFTQGSKLTIFDTFPIFDITIPYLVMCKANTVNGIKIYMNGTLVSMGNAGNFGGGASSVIQQLKVFHFVNNLYNPGSVQLSQLSIFSTASQMDYSSMVTTTPSPGILPTSFTSGVTKLRKYFITSGSPAPSPNVNLSGIEARFDQHRFYYPRPNKMSFTLRGGSNG